MSTYFEKSQHPDRKGGGGETLTVSLTVKRPFFLTTSLHLVSTLFAYFLAQWGPGSHVQNWYAGNPLP